MQNPDYPPDLRTEGIKGTVTIEFVVAVDGSVSAAKALDSPHPKLAEAAIAAMMKSKFEPALRNGIATPAILRAPITFSVDEKR